MNRDELFEHMLADSYHSKGRKMWLRELRDKGYYEHWNKRTLRQGTVIAKSMHKADHDHPEHAHEAAE